MASESDELIKSLEFDLALAGEDGLTYKQLQEKVAAFKNAHKVNHQPAAQQVEQPQKVEDILFSEAPPDSTSSSNDQLVDTAWDYLSSIKDIQIRRGISDDIGPHSGERLTATTEQLWQAIAGHGVDLTRVKGAEFSLLHIIAKAGPAGIAQPEVVKLSGQDKRSVPTRTDRLAKNGYITKTPIISHAAKTSLLVLKKYAVAGNDIGVPDTLDNSLVFYETWWSVFVRLLQENNNIVVMDDLKAELGLGFKDLRVRALQRCLRRLQTGGGVRRVKATVTGGDRQRQMQCIQVLRPLTIADKGLWAPDLKSGKHQLADEENDDEQVDDYEDIEATSIVTAQKSQLVSQWNPDIPITNFIHDIVESTGQQGMSIIELHRRGAGLLWRRPMDEELIRLCDHWETSQPSHLKHLTIIKDTTVVDKFTLFKYRTIDNFQKAADAGEALWEVVATKKKGKSKHNTRETVLDQHGFSVLPTSLFVGTTPGTASIQETAKVAALPAIFLSRLERGFFTQGEANIKPLTRYITDGKTGTPVKRRRLPSATLKVPKVESVDSEPEDDVTQRSPFIAINSRSAIKDRHASITTRGRRPKTLMATFRSTKLKDLDWTLKPPPVWNEPVATRGRPVKKSALSPFTSIFRSQGEQQSIASPFPQSPLSVANTTVANLDHDALPGAETSTATIREAVEISSIVRLPASSVPTIASPSVDRVKRGLQKGGIGRAAGSVQVRRTQIIMSILEKCGGVYPGNREIFNPVSVVLKQEQNGKIESSTCENTIKDLITRGKLKKIFFQFSGRDGMQIRRAILAEPSVVPGDARIKGLQEKMIEAYPQKYYPPGAPTLIDVGLESSVIPDSKRYPPPIPSPATPDAQATRSSLPSIIVRRTPMGLAIEQDKMMLAPLVDTEDEDVSDESSEQRQLMHSFEAGDYNHDPSHAFRKRKNPKAVERETSWEKFFARPKVYTPKRELPRLIGTHRTVSFAAPGLSATAPTRIVPSADMRARHLMLHPGSSFQPVTGTFGTNAICSASTTTLLSRLAPPRLGKRGPIARLSSLASGPFGMPAGRMGVLVRQHNQSFHPGTFAMSSSIRDLPQKRSHAAMAASNLAPESTSGAGDLQNIDSMQPVEKRAKSYKSMRGQDVTPETPVLDGEPRDMLVEGIIGPTFSLSKKRDRKAPQMFQENERLTTAVALFRVVVGGMDQRVNWGVVAHLLGFKYEPEFLRRRWDGMKNAKEDAVRAMMLKIYEPFLTAYEEGRLPTIDFNELNKTDWPTVLQWLEEEVITTSMFQESQALPNLPRSLVDFHAACTVTESATFWEHSREAWFTTSADKTRKDTAHEFIYGVPLPGHARPASSFHDDRVVVRSMIRAISATKSDFYDASRAAALLQRFPEELVAQTNDELLASKIVRHLNKGRLQPGRNFEIHDAFLTLFKRWPLGRGGTEWQFVRDIAHARRLLLDQLKTGRRLYLHFHASDVEIIVLDNLVEQGMLKLTTELPDRVDDFEAPFPKISAFGYSGYNYNAKTLAKDKLRFPLVYEKTHRFTTDHGLITGVNIPLAPHRGSKLDDGRVPLWTDIHGYLLPDIWDMVIRSLLHLVVFRPGCTAATMEQSHNHRFLTWEIDLALEWMEQSNIIEKCGDGGMGDGAWQGGWRSCEWWYCAFDPEMTFWKSS